MTELLFSKRVDQYMDRFRLKYFPNEGLVKKVIEETAELNQDIKEGRGIDNELGDVIFTLSCLANGYSFKNGYGFKDLTDQVYMAPVSIHRSTLEKKHGLVLHLSDQLVNYADEISENMDDKQKVRKIYGDMIRCVYMIADINGVPFPEIFLERSISKYIGRNDPKKNLK